MLLLKERPVKLGGRAFELLQLLVQRRGELVSKNELMAAAWPGTFLHDGTVPKTLAPNLALIRARIREKPTDTVFLSKEMEDTLIHFSHARKLQRNKAAEPMHAAKQMREYLESLKLGGVSDVHDYYSQLCSITHPSAETVMIWFEGEKDGDQVVWRRTNDTHRDRIDRFLLGWKQTNELVVAAAFMPALTSLRMLHKLDFLPKIPSLKSLPLEMPVWKEFERHLRR
ncbi:MULTISPECIES: winged helix-turn-helix domain-containing protein [Bradyrhizobium]|uniref:winged helix-turn-helix domain-containing protein n=1 Tax=Bradyrhizobium elkanii TaxID=29448 RepID=UPI0009B7A567|nr:winged helix-turn-helix domain-containing protein [Bradyrhizobium elkanii]